MTDKELSICGCPLMCIIWKFAVTPPLKNVRKRRFRKIKTKKVSILFISVRLKCSLNDVMMDVVVDDRITRGGKGSETIIKSRYLCSQCVYPYSIIALPS